MNTLTRRLALVILLLGLALGVVLGQLARAYPPKAHADGPDMLNDRGSLWNAPAPVISGNLLATPIKTAPTQPASLFRIAVVLKATNTLYVSETDGTTTQVFALNGGTSLTAFQAYTFVWEARQQTPAGAPLSYNFQLGTASNAGVAVLRVTECLGGVD